MAEQPWVIITGASRGIGAACALRLAEEGMSLCLVGRQLDTLHSIAQKCLELGATAVQTYALDLGDLEAIKHTFQQINKTKITLFGLVNAAGLMLPQALMMTQQHNIAQQFQVNSVAPLVMAQYASRLMLRQKSGCIINLSSAVAEQGAAGQAAYAASKSAVDGLTKSLARELGPLGIRVNGVRPGIIDTDLLKPLSSEQRQATIDACDLKRIGQASEVAELVSFLLSDKASYIHGQIIGIDGGLSL